MVPTASPSHPPASMCSASFSSMRRWSSDQSNFYLLFLFFIIILFAWRPEFGLLPLPVWKTNFNIMPVPEIRLAICTIFSPEADSDNEEVVQQLKPNSSSSACFCSKKGSPSGWCYPLPWAPCDAPWKRPPWMDVNMYAGHARSSPMFYLLFLLFCFLLCFCLLLIFDNELLRFL